MIDVDQLKKEFVNSVSHGFGLLLALTGIPVLMYFALESGNPKYYYGTGIYSVSLFMVYFSSTFYHFLQSPRLKRFFRILDHISIYFLIAGSYTPFIFLFLDTAPGWTVLIGLWCTVVIGTIFKIYYTHRFDKLSTALYLLMGWAFIFIAEPFIAQMPTMCLIWLGLGGLSYTFGTIFYLWKGLKYHHGIWHIFVLIGSLCHYISVLIGVTHFY